ncbi:MAG: pilus assembly protein PilB, partial [Planctomycetota bacterium]|nr:pilus assembly protein PilB [Planctomycetota bacterium]
MAARRIGQIFVDLGFITDEQLDMLVEEQSQNPGRLIGRIAMEMGLLDEDQLAQALAEQMNLQIIDLEGLDISDEVLEEVSDAMAQLYKVVPLRLSDGVLTVATCEPQNLSMEDELRRFLGYDIRLLIAIESQINKTIDRYYSEEQETLEKILEELENDTDLKKAAQELSGDGPINLTDVAELADSAPVRKLLNMVLLLAIKDHASDIHFEPFEDEFRIRIKSDGVLYEMVPPPRHLAFAITTRVKV